MQFTWKHVVVASISIAAAAAAYIWAPTHAAAAVSALTALVALFVRSPQDERRLKP